MDKHLATSICGGLSQPSKMPGYGYSIPADKCKTGMSMRNVQGTICSKCYAMKGRYVFPLVKAAMERRFNSLDHPQWAEAMAFLINSKATSHFRWHDSGDIQSIEHLENIVKVCELTPDVKHWLPTREYGIVAQYALKYGVFPPNLTIRLSAYKFGNALPVSVAKSIGVQCSGVDAQEVFQCPAPKQGNICGGCRACWDKNVFATSYKKH